MYRRSALRALGIGTATLVSGCLGVRQSQPRYFESVYVRNDDDTSHAFALAIEQGGETVQESTIELPRLLGRLASTVCGRVVGRTR